MSVRARQPSPLLRLRGLSKTFHQGETAIPVLKGIDLDIDAGEMVAIVGQSGSGKSTLMHILGCLDRPTEGNYWVDGHDTGHWDSDTRAAWRRERFGFVFQRYHLLSHLSARENVEVPGVYRRHAGNLRARRASALLSALGLAEREGHRPAELSGGQQQRVSMARALMNGGDVILADEPTGALDRRSGAAVLSTLRMLNRRGHTVIVVTHDRSVAAATDRIIDLRDGVIVSDRAITASLDSDMTEDAAYAAYAAYAANPQETGRLGERGTTADGARRGSWCSGMRDTFIGALIALRRHRMRTLLTMTSITLGIASVVSMSAVGGGARMQMLNEIRSWGADAIYVLPGSSETDTRASAIQTLTLADVAALSAQPYVDAVTPVVGLALEVRRGSAQANAYLRGVDRDYFRIRQRRLVEGSLFGAAQITAMAPVVIIDEVTRRAFFRPDEHAVGGSLLVDGVPSTVVGVLASEDESGDRDALQIFMPANTVNARFTGQRHVNRLMVKLHDGEDFSRAEDQITRLLTMRHGTRDFYLLSFDKQLKAQQRSADMMNMLMLSTAMITLIVAGLGVMNIMLVSITERTAEIGIRLAVGARQQDIRRQFLSEAAVVCTLGGLLGIGLSLALYRILPTILPSVPLQLSTGSVLVSCVASTLIGIAFGYWPARNAAKLDPIKALAHD